MQRRCTTELQKAGVAYPRTCQICGLGPCRYYKEPKRGPVKIYLAARFDSRSEMEKVADRLKTFGYEITARWVYGGEEGLSRQEIAKLDLDDVDAADTVVSFTHPRGSLQSNGGGRHVEFGYALAKGKRLVLIGERENVFHDAAGVECFGSVDAWLASEARK